MENAVASETSQFERMFEEAEEMSINARKEAERARDYVDGRQLTHAEREALKKRGQPDIVINRVRRKIETMRGMEIKQRTDPKAFPRTPRHEQDAESITDAMRFVAENTNWDHHRSCVWENMLVEGLGGVEVVHREKPDGEVDIVVNHYPWDRLFFDPYSRKSDFSDARYKGVVIWKDAAEVAEMYEGAQEAIDLLQTQETVQSNSYSETYDDRPRHGKWYDARRKRVRMVLVWYKEKGEWHWCRFIKGQKLDGGRSPYVDEHGRSVCPLEMQSLYCDRDNDRYGMVRDMFSPQDEINRRRSKALHALNTNQIIASRGMLRDASEARREIARPDGILEYEADPKGNIEIRTNGELAAGQAQLLQEAKQEIDLMAANAAIEGETGESTSGRAVLARQQGGMLEIAPLMDELHDLTKRVYEHMWQRIRQFWTSEKWVRVSDDERNIRFVGLNQPVALQDRLQEMPPEQVRQIALRMGLRPGDPRLSMPVDIRNNVAEIEVDIILEEVPDRVTLQGEAFEALLRYAQSGAIPPQVLIEADPTLPASKKEKLLEMMAEAAQQPNPMAEAEVQGKQASAAKDMAAAQQTQVETQQMAAGFR